MYRWQVPALNAKNVDFDQFLEFFDNINPADLPMYERYVFKTYDKASNKYIDKRSEVERDFNEMANKLTDVNAGRSGGLKYLKSINAHEKQDVYSIGLIIMRLISGNGKRKGAQENLKTVRAFEELMCGMLYPTPEKRFSIEQCIECVKTIIENNSTLPDPFKVNQDSDLIQRIYAQRFGKRTNGTLRSFLKYINTLL
jgi:hypothetical protein